MYSNLKEKSGICSFSDNLAHFVPKYDIPATASIWDMKHVMLNNLYISFHMLRQSSAFYSLLEMKVCSKADDNKIGSLGLRFHLSKGED